MCGLVAEGFGLTLLPELAASAGLCLMRFAAPEPRRTLALLRREGSSGGGWVDNLADVLSAAGQSELAAGRAAVQAAQAAE